MHYNNAMCCVLTQGLVFRWRKTQRKFVGWSPTHEVNDFKFPLQFEFDFSFCPSLQLSPQVQRRFGVSGFKAGMLSLGVDEDLVEKPNT